jgi:chromosome segregation ATPase
LTYTDLAEALQARLRARRGRDRNPARKLPITDDNRRIEALETQIATLQDAVVTTEALGEQQRQEAGRAARRVVTLEAHVATLEDAVAKAEALAEQQRQEAETAAKRIEILEAHFAQVAIGINLAIMMGKGQVAGCDVKRLQGIADTIAGLRTVHRV